MMSAKHVSACDHHRNIEPPCHHRRSALCMAHLSYLASSVLSVDLAACKASVFLAT